MGGRQAWAVIVGTLVVGTGLLLGCSGSDSPTGASGEVDVNGRLVRHAGGAGIGGAQVLVNGQSAAVTDAAGGFKVALDGGGHTITVNAGGGESLPMMFAVDGLEVLNVVLELDNGGVLTSHEDVNDDHGIDANDDIDDDRDVDDDDADGDIDNDGDIDVDDDIDDDGDDDQDDHGDDDGTDDVGDDNGDDVGDDK